MFDNIIGQRIRKLRESAGLTQIELAEIIYVDSNMLSRYERGRHMPSIQTLVCIADYFEVTLDYLCGREDKNAG